MISKRASRVCVRPTGLWPVPADATTGPSTRATMAAERLRPGIAFTGDSFDWRRGGAIRGPRPDPHVDLVNLCRAGGVEDLPRQLHAIAVGVHTDEDSALANLLVVELGLVLRNPEPDQAADQTTSSRARSETGECGHDRSCGDQADPGHCQRAERDQTGGNGAEHPTDGRARGGALGGLRAVLHLEFTATRALGHEDAC